MVVPRRVQILVRAGSIVVPRRSSRMRIRCKSGVQSHVRAGSTTVVPRRVQILVRAAGEGETQPGVREAEEGQGQLAARFALLEVVVGRTGRVY